MPVFKGAYLLTGEEGVGLREGRMNGKVDGGKKWTRDKEGSEGKKGKGK